MTRLITICLTALLLTNCTTKSVTNGNSKQLTNSIKSLSNQTNELVRRVIIPFECFDDNGNFDSNKGHDSLDCDNL